MKMKTKKEIKERIIFDNYDYDYDAIKRDMLEDEFSDYTSIEEISDADVYEEIRFIEEVSWDYFRSDFENFINGKTLLATGSVGTWRGRLNGGIFIESLSDFYKLITDCDYVKIYDKNGHLYIESSHHDGTNYYELKEVTELGMKHYENWREKNCYNLFEEQIHSKEEEIHNKIMETSNYSRLPRYAEKVWGCPKMEYVAM